MIALLVICAAVLVAIVADFFREARRAAMRGERTFAVLCAGGAWLVIVSMVSLALYALTPNPDVGWFGVVLAVLIGYLHVRRLGRIASAAGTPR